MRAAVNRPFYIARFLIEIGDLAIFLSFCRCICRGTFTIHQPIRAQRTRRYTFMAFFNSAAKKAFDAYKKENGSDKKLPRISELNAEYAMLLERKKSSYAEYRKTKSEMCKIMYIASVTLCVEDI